VVVERDHVITLDSIILWASATGIIPEVQKDGRKDERRKEGKRIEEGSSNEGRTTEGSKVKEGRKEGRKLKVIILRASATGIIPEVRKEGRKDERRKEGKRI
jgi:hypothetical protein